MTSKQLIEHTTKTVNEILSKSFTSKYGYFKKVIPSPIYMLGETHGGTFVYFNYSGTHHIAKEGITCNE